MRMHLTAAVLLGLAGLPFAAPERSFADLGYSAGIQSNDDYTLADALVLGVEVPNLLGRFAPGYAYSTSNERVSVSVGTDLSKSGFEELTTVGHRV